MHFFQISLNIDILLYSDCSAGENLIEMNQIKKSLTGMVISKQTDEKMNRYWNSGWMVDFMIIINTMSGNW